MIPTAQNQVLYNEGNTNRRIKQYRRMNSYLKFLSRHRLFTIINIV